MHPAPPASPAPEAVIAPEPAAPPRPARLRPARGVQPGLVAAWLVAAVGLTVSVLLWQKVPSMQESLARQSQDAGSQSVEARTPARQAEESARAMSGKVAALETKVVDMTAYRPQPDPLPPTVARPPDSTSSDAIALAVSIGGR